MDPPDPPIQGSRGVLTLENTGDVTCAMQDPEHLDGLFDGPVVNHVWRDDEAAKSLLKFIAPLAHVGKPDMHPAAFQNRIDHPIRSIDIVRRDVRPEIVEVRFGLLGELRSFMPSSTCPQRRDAPVRVL